MKVLLFLVSPQGIICRLGHRSKLSREAVLKLEKEIFNGEEGVGVVNAEPEAEIEKLVSVQ